MTGDIIDLTLQEDSDGEEEQKCLLEALETCPADRLRLILVQKAKTDASLRRALRPHLVTRVPGKLKGIKRKPVPKWEVCSQCGEQFDAGKEREEEECQYHPGELEVDWDSDAWADWDERCHGPIDSDSNKNDVPDGFKWTCCDDTGDASGCELAAHSSKRLKTAHS